jgi:hypothetical protein
LKFSLILSSKNNYRKSEKRKEGKWGKRKELKETERVEQM